MDAKITSPPPPSPYSPFLSAALPRSQESSVQIRWRHRVPEKLSAFWPHSSCYTAGLAELAQKLPFHALPRCVHSTYTNTYVHTSAYLSSCRPWSRGGANRDVKPFAAGFHTCTWASLREPAVTSRWMRVQLQNTKASCIMWPHTDKRYFSVQRGLDFVIFFPKRNKAGGFYKTGPGSHESYITEFLNLNVTSLWRTGTFSSPIREPESLFTLTSLFNNQWVIDYFDGYGDGAARWCGG